MQPRVPGSRSIRSSEASVACAGDVADIRVRSILGRFLEHSRSLRFGSDARGAEYFIGSADLMPRNLDLRVEALVPVEDPALRESLEVVLGLLLHPEARAWSLGADGTWKQSGGTIDVQQALQQRVSEGG